MITVEQLTAERDRVSRQLAALEALLALISGDEMVPKHSLPAKKQGSPKNGKTTAKRASHGKYDPDQVANLAERVEAGAITAQEAADKLGVTKANWYYIRKTYAGDKSGRKAPTKRTYKKRNPVNDAPADSEEAKADTRTDDDLRSEVHILQAHGFDALHIASKLKIRLKKVNELWDPDIAVENARKDEEDEEI